MSSHPMTTRSQDVKPSSAPEPKPNFTFVIHPRDFHKVGLVRVTDLLREEDRARVAAPDPSGMKPHPSRYVVVSEFSNAPGEFIVDEGSLDLSPFNLFL